MHAIVPAESTAAVSNGRVVDDPDRRLLDRFRRDGDRDALEVLLTSHIDVAYRVALRLAGNVTDAEDVLQDAFLHCFACAR